MRSLPPDFVIVGAPKCATTAVYKTLRHHPGIFLPGLKEPQYFAFDHRWGRAVEKTDLYDHLYAEAADFQLRGDASALYLSSNCAISAILERRPDAKFIALIRDPVEMFISWHNECLKALDEDEKDPERAWRLQDERAAGRVPQLCKEPVYLQYRKICSLGWQIQRMFALVPAAQRLVIVVDGPGHGSSAVPEQILDFLGVADTGTRELGRDNAFASHRSHLAARVIRLVHVSPLFKSLRLRLKPVLNKFGIYPLTWVVNSSLRKVVKPALSESFERELREEFRSDILLTEKLLGRSFPEWLGDEAPSARPTLNHRAST
jgi:hypothetical protein